MSKKVTDQKKENDLKEFNDQTVIKNDLKKNKF